MPSFKENLEDAMRAIETLDDTKYILFGLFEKFGATDKQKDKIKAFKNNYNNKIEEEKREKFNPDNIFVKRNNAENILINNYESLQNALVKVKEPSILHKIISNLRKFFAYELN